MASRRTIVSVALYLCGAMVWAQQASEPPVPQASALLSKLQGGMLQRTAGTPPFHIKLELTQMYGEKKVVTAGWYEETWHDAKNWHREAQLGSKHVVQSDVDGERDVIVTPALDAEGVRISALAQWALPEYEGDPDSGVLQHVISHAPDGRDVPMLRVGTRSVTKERPFMPDAGAWYLAEGEPKLLGLMDGDFFVEYLDRQAFAGKSVASGWTVTTEAKTFLRAKLVVMEAAK